jgi:hypothetical protein
MKFRLLYISIVLFFAFAKNTQAAVLSVAKPFCIAATTIDSTAENEAHRSAMREYAKETISTLMKEARKSANLAFLALSVFALLSLLVGFGFSLLIFGAIIFGFVMSIKSLLKIIKIRGIVENFPELEKDVSFKQKLLDSYTRTIAAFSIFSIGILSLLVLAVIFSGNFPSVVTVGLLAMIMMFIFDSRVFQIGKKTKK